MGKEELEVLKSKFLGIIANIPEDIRSRDILVVVDDKPYTWNNSALEIKGNTETGKKILKILNEDLKII